VLVDKLEGDNDLGWFGCLTGSGRIRLRIGCDCAGDDEHQRYKSLAILHKVTS